MNDNLKNVTLMRIEYQLSVSNAIEIAKLKLMDQSNNAQVLPDCIRDINVLKDQLDKNLDTFFTDEQKTSTEDVIANMNNESQNASESE